MNFLAHAALSYGFEEELVGNFIADTVRGKVLFEFPEGIRKGIELHRKIDQFTDKHVYFKRTTERLKQNYARYSCVIADIFYDYCLALTWDEFFSENLDRFAARVYVSLEKYQGLFSDKQKNMIRHATERNWLLNYREISGIERSLWGLSRRAKYNPGIEKAGKALLLDLPVILVEFRIVFNDLQTYVKEQRDQSAPLTLL